MDTKSATLPKRTLEELVQIHKLEPTTADLVVEGPSDQDLLEWFCHRQELDVVVYTIDSFEVGAAAVLELGLEDNNRGRVVSLAKAAAELMPSSAKILCVVDKDFDDLIETPHTYPTLVKTDYSSMEMYAFNESALGKFLTLQVRKLKKVAQKILDDLAPVLRQLFACRLANKLTSLGLSAVEWHKLLKIKASGVTFDVATFCKRSLQKSGQTDHADKFETARAQAFVRLVGDVRNFINGHDFTVMLAWYLKHHSGCGRRDETEVQRQLYTALEHTELSAAPLFATITNKFHSPKVATAALS